MLNAIESRLMKAFTFALFGLLLLAGEAERAKAATDLQFWFGVSGANAEVIQSLAREFNATQAEFRVVPVFKGTYPETLQAGLAAFEAGRPPHIIQVFDVGPAS